MHVLHYFCNLKTNIICYFQLPRGTKLCKMGDIQLKTCFDPDNLMSIAELFDNCILNAPRISKDTAVVPYGPMVVKNKQLVHADDFVKMRESEVCFTCERRMNMIGINVCVPLKSLSCSAKRCFSFPRHFRM